MSGLRVQHRGLPSALPAGETVLWSGAPDWRVLARSALHARKLAAYFAVLALYAGLSQRSLGSFGVTMAVGAIPVGFAALYAWIVSRSSVYTITNRRVVMHIGLALPVTLNLPHERIEAADLRAGSGGSGDLSLTLAGTDRFAYAVLWPHARPWRFSPAQPTLRGLADVAVPAQALARALAAVAAQPPMVVSTGEASHALPQHASLAA